MKLWMILATLVLSGCATSTVMLGEARTPTHPDSVKIYRTAPAGFEEIALISSDDRGAFNISEQGRTNTTINRMKREAAKLGANGILLTELGTEVSGYTTTGNATAHAYGNSATAFGSSTSIPIKRTVGQSVAIWVFEE